MKYIIKKHYEATESNKQFENSIIDYYEGKGSITLSENEMPSAWLVELYGYTTLAGAKRALKCAQELADWETVGGNWNVTVELIQL